MANSNIIIRIDENVKAKLQELVANLGMDITTFFTLTAKQAIRQQALPFTPSMNHSTFTLDDYIFAMKNTKYNEDRKAVISKDDEWLEETEWDELYEELRKERGLK